MGFLDKVSETITTAGKDVSNKAKEIAEVTKLKNAISAEEKKIKAAYETIGRKYVAQYREQNDALFKEEIAEIDHCNEVIDLRRKELSQVKNTAICPACGAAVEEGSTFCNKCGSKL